MVSLVLYVSGGIYYRVFLQLVVRASRGRVYCNEEERRKEREERRKEIEESSERREKRDERAGLDRGGKEKRCRER